MNSKLRFLGDGMADAYVKCYFSRLRSTSSALLGLLSLDVERETTHFGPNPPNHGYIIIARSPSSTTCKKAIDLPAMRLVNVATKKSHSIQRIEVFTKTVGVELPLKNLKGPFA